MQIRIPNFLVAAWDTFGDWANVPVYRRRAFGREIAILRLDVLLVVFGIVCAIYYLLFWSWQWMVIGTLVYIMTVMMSIWFR